MQLQDIRRRWQGGAGPRGRIIVAAIATAAAIAGCSEAFEPLAPTDLRFSIYGYLDASADTQWIRVMPIRPVIVTSPEDSFGAVVTLEEIGTGRIIVLRDSVFRFSSHQDPDIGSDGLYVHNFWTTERITPGASYRFTATHGDGPPAEAIVEIPDTFQAEVGIAQPGQGGDMLRIPGLKHAAFVTVTNHFRDRCGTAAASSSFRPPPADGDVYYIPLIRGALTPRDGCDDPIFMSRNVSVIGAETAWPSGDNHSPASLFPGGASNVTNAFGYITGALSRLYPYEQCDFEGPREEAPSHCMLRYDATSATIRGTVMETHCGNTPVDSAIVRLHELDRLPRPHRKIRTTTTNLDGEFEMAGLEPGVRYSVWVRARQIINPSIPRIPYILDTHTEHNDTVAFTPGEQKLYHVELQQLNACGYPPYL